MNDANIATLSNFSSTLPQEVVDLKSPAAIVVFKQITYWFSQGISGKRRVRISVDGQPCVAKSAKEMAQECGLTYDMVVKAYRKLRKAGLIRIKIKRFNGSPTTHIFLPACVKKNSEESQSQETNSRFGRLDLAKSIWPTGQLDLAIQPDGSGPPAKTLTVTTAVITTTPLTPQSGESFSSQTETEIQVVKETETEEVDVKGNVSDTASAIVAKIRVVPDEQLPYPTHPTEQEQASLDSRRSLRTLGLNPRALGTNPRAIHVKREEKVREAKQNSWRKIFNADPTNPPTTPEVTGSLVSRVLGLIGQGKKENGPSCGAKSENEG